MRALIGAVVILALTGTSTAADVDAKKLIGKWEPTDGPKIVIEFTDKGKLTVAIDVGGKAEKIEGTYTIKDDKLDVVMSFEGKEKKETLTITKLTDDELVSKDAKGKEEKFKKVKPK